MVAEIRGFSTALFDCELVVEIANTDPAISEFMKLQLFLVGLVKWKINVKYEGGFIARKSLVSA